MPRCTCAVGNGRPASAHRQIDNPTPEQIEHFWAERRKGRAISPVSIMEMRARMTNGTITAIHFWCEHEWEFDFASDHCPHTHVH